MLGVNESIFPAAPVILTFSDRDELEKQNIALGLNPFEQVSRERYLSYNAYTRANEKLALKFSRQTADGKTLNPSPFAAQLRRIFPHLEIEEVSTEQN
jgi:ATP-dependent helicase/DNAse subunit B